MTEMYSGYPMETRVWRRCIYVAKLSALGLLTGWMFGRRYWSAYLHLSLHGAGVLASHRNAVRVLWWESGRRYYYR